MGCWVKKPKETNVSAREHGRRDKTSHWGVRTRSLIAVSFLDQLLEVASTVHPLRQLTWATLLCFKQGAAVSIHRGYRGFQAYRDDRMQGLLPLSYSFVFVLEEHVAADDVILPLSIAQHPASSIERVPF